MTTAGGLTRYCHCVLPLTGYRQYSPLLVLPLTGYMQ